MESKYNPTDIEARWYQYWLDNKLFHSEPDGREPYTIVIPPPNVTGVLHMGHVLNETIQDILVRLLSVYSIVFLCYRRSRYYPSCSPRWFV